ncbi:putative ribonuclease H-like domain-containing protein, partial [Tanacetum coccineum]
CYKTGPAPVYAGTPVPAGRQNRPTSVHADRPFPAARRNSDSVSADRELLLSRQQVVLGETVDHIRKGDPRTMENPFKNKDLGGTVTFGDGEGRITGKGTIRTSKLDFENVYYVKELHHFNLFLVSQICDKKNNVLFTETKCLVLSKDFKLPDNSQVILGVPRRHNLYSFNINELQPEGTLTCLGAKASLDVSTKWHRRMAHVNFKNISKLAKNGLVKGLPSKIFSNEHNCVACNKGKQHKASYKAITSIDHKYYCLVVTDDFSRFCCAFFLGTKDETFHTLKEFITFIENQLNLKVKAIRCDNGTEFKNSKLIELCGQKEIRRDYSNARTPQQNEVAERKNITLIEAARTMLTDSKLPTMFWTEVVSTACYVLNRVLVTSPHIKTPYELLSGKVPNISHFKPFGCQVTILNTSEHLGKFDRKADDKKVEETFNLRYLEDKPNIQGAGHEWYFDLDYLTDTLGYTRFKANQPTGAQDTHINAGTQDDDSDSECDEQVIIVPSFPSNNFSGSKVKDTFDTEELLRQATIEAYRNLDLAGSVPVPAGSKPVHAAHTPLPPAHFTRYPTPSDLGNSLSLSSELEDIHHHPSIGIFSSSSYDADFSVDANNLAPTVDVNSLVTKRANTIHPQSLILGDPTSAVQTRSKKVRKLVPLPDGKTAIRTKWILKNKRDARGIVVRNKARLVAQGHRQEENINYDEVFAPVAKIETIRLFLAFASYMGFMDPHFPKHVYKVVKALYGLHQAPRAWDIILVQVYVDDIIFGSTKKTWCDEFEVLMKGEFETSVMGELPFFLGLQVKQKPDGIFISQDKYVQDMLKKFDIESMRTATTPYEALKPKSKDEPDDAVNVHLYRSMIGSLMYLTASRPNIMFVVSACSRHQVTPLTSHLNVVKKIFKYLKGQPKLGVWYPRDSPFVLEAYSDSDCAGLHGDRKSTTGRCQFLGRRLISWQCKK